MFPEDRPRRARSRTVLDDEVSTNARDAVTATDRVDGPATPSESAPTPVRRPWEIWVFLGSMAAALLLTLLTVVWLPADRELSNIAEWLFRLSPMVFAVIAAAYFPRRSGLNLVLLAGAVLAFMALFDTFLIIRILEYVRTAAEDRPAAFPKLYQATILLDAFVLVGLCWAYRLGGAKSYKVVRLGIAGVFLVTSGVNDVSYYYLQKWPEGRPDRLDAPHIAIFVGGDPTPTVAIIFLVVNLLIAAAILVVPWWLVRRRSAVSATPARS